MCCAVQAFRADRCCKHASLYFVNASMMICKTIQLKFSHCIATLQKLVRSLITRWKWHCFAGASSNANVARFTVADSWLLTQLGLE
jgi:hypothetical protein